VFNPRQELLCAVPGDKWLLLGYKLWADKRWDIQPRLVWEQGEKLKGSTSSPIAALLWLLRVHTIVWQLYAGAIHADSERVFGKEEPGLNDKYA